MHFSLLVITDQKPDEAQLASLMAPFCEEGSEIEENQKWDWYQLGGRWTGHFDGYDPETDPNNIEVLQHMRWNGET
jgi:hypothetical protein